MKFWVLNIYYEFKHKLHKVYDVVRAEDESRAVEIYQEEYPGLLGIEASHPSYDSWEQAESVCKALLELETIRSQDGSSASALRHIYEKAMEGKRKYARKNKRK